MFGTSAITAVTAQNTLGVERVQTIDPEVVTAQIRAVLDDLPPAATKTGMLATPQIVRAVSEFAARGLLANLVVDPVLVSTSGHVLMEEGGVQAYRDLLFPVADVVTPNLHEAALLASVAPETLTSTSAAAKVAEALRSLGPRAVIVKGGHMGSDRAADVVATATGVAVIDRPRVETKNDHGTGCTLSAAIAAQLALGTGLLEAIERAKDYVQAALVGGARWHLGAGHGPVDHFGWSDQLPR